VVDIVLPDTVLNPPAVSFKLPDGTLCEMWDPVGSDLTKALRMVSAKAASTDQSYALIAVISRFNGQPKKVEEVRAMKLRDLNIIMKHFVTLMGAGDDPLEKKEGEELDS
jgi:hypothetical protein